MRYARTLWELLERRVDATPDGLMFVDEDMRTLTFAEFWSEAERAAAGLASSGLGPGDVVSWQLPTWIETMVLVAALRRVDVVQNPLLTTLRERELDQICSQVGTDLLVAPSSFRGFDHEALARDIAQRVGGMRVLLVDRALPQGDPTTLAEVEDPLEPDDQGVHWLYPTSGTTAEPKIVRHADATLLAAARGMTQRLGLIAHDRNSLVFPAGHVGGVVWLMSSLLSGCANIVIESFDADETPEVLGREGVTLAGAGTVFHQAYVARQRQVLHPIFPDVRAFPGGGAPKPPSLVEEVRAVFDVPVLSGYGLTEAPILTMASLSDPDDALAQTEGAPVPGVEVRLVGSDARIVDPGGEGEIRVRAPQLMRGYLDRSLDAEAIDDDGFFRTGDLGRLDERGELVVTGRLKDMIVRKGENVSAKELEDLLHEHDKIDQAAVIGLPDPDTGERVCAVVQLRDGCDGVTLDEVVIHLRDRGLMSQKLPERVEVVTELPRNPSGKVLKHVLRDEFKG